MSRWGREVIIRLCGSWRCGREQKRLSLRLILSRKKLKELKKSLIPGKAKKQIVRRPLPTLWAN